MPATLESPQNGPAPAQKLAPHVETPMERIQRVKGYLYDKTLIEKEDYGIIPGANKPSLFKPGAQKLCGLFQLAPVIKDVKRVMKDDFIAYEVMVQVVNKVSAVVEAEGAGMCNSRERKYKNKDAYEVANTLLKMATKRGLVDATLSALGISSLFTQDIEDFAPETPAAAPAEEKEEKFDLSGDTLYLRQSLEWVKTYCPKHSQKRAIVEELTRRVAAQKEAEKQSATPAETAPEPTPVDRWAAINAAAQTGKGYMDFIAAAQARGFRWADDADVKAFEEAATAKTGYPIVAEELGPNDWAEWAAMVNNGEVSWG